MGTLTALATEPVPRPQHAGALAPVLIGLLQKDPAARLTAAETDRLLRRAIKRRSFPRRVPVAPVLTDDDPDHRPPSPVPAQAQIDAVPEPPTTKVPMPADGPVIASPFADPAHRNRRRTATLAVIAILVFGVVAAAFLLVPTLRGDRSNGSAGSDTTAGQASGRPVHRTSPSVGSAGRSPQVSPSASLAKAPATSQPEPQHGSGGTPFALPSGWQMRGNGTGFAVPVPIGWQFGHDSDGRPLWRDPSHTKLLLIDQSRHPKSNPVQDWLNNEAARRDGYQDYHRIKISSVRYWDKAADWEFTYTLHGTSLHVLNRGFITAPDQAYSIYWSTPASQWVASKSQLSIILQGFRPARR